MASRRPTAKSAPGEGSPNARAGRLPIAGRLIAVARLIHRSALRTYPGETGLTFVDAGVIGGIGGRGPLSASELAQQLTMHEGHLSRSLKSLEKEGFLARVPDPADSRRRMVMLTREGKAVYRAVVAVQERRERELLAGIGGSDLDAFFRTLAAIQRNADAMVEGGGAEGGTDGAAP
ncbi:MAG: MarR family transcriptional regulator [Rhodospirillaceae bacterium]